MPCVTLLLNFVLLVSYLTFSLVLISYKHGTSPDLRKLSQYQWKTLQKRKHILLESKRKCSVWLNMTHGQLQCLRIIHHCWRGHESFTATVYPSSCISATTCCSGAQEHIAMHDHNYCSQDVVLQQPATDLTDVTQEQYNSSEIQNMLDSV